MPVLMVSGLPPTRQVVGSRAAQPFLENGR